MFFLSGMTIKILSSHDTFVTVGGGFYSILDVTFALDTPQSTCCSGRSPGPPVLHGCRSSKTIGTALRPWIHHFKLVSTFCMLPSYNEKIVFSFFVKSHSAAAATAANEFLRQEIEKIFQGRQLHLAWLKSTWCHGWKVTCAEGRQSRRVEKERELKIFLPPPSVFLPPACSPTCHRSVLLCRPFWLVIIPNLSLFWNPSIILLLLLLLKKKKSSPPPWQNLSLWMTF